MPSSLTMLNINNLRFPNNQEHRAAQALLPTSTAYHTRAAKSTRKFGKGSGPGEVTCSFSVFLDF